MSEELSAAGAQTTDFQLVSWEPEPNPKSYNPTALQTSKGKKSRAFRPDDFTPTDLTPAKPGGKFNSKGDVGSPGGIDFGTPGGIDFG